ncbi:MAG: NAD-dependent epimerase/dehydratase family protein [Patescibacteria group bacterium]|nr:NAD-dependent epimerase/dehydratase family protein [Patescibacteria group bacterium]
MNSTKQKSVVTGGAGFIGSNLASVLVTEGYEVHVVDNLSGGKRENVPAGAVFHEMDINDTPALAEIFADARYVFHLAALPRVPYSIEHPQETNHANVDGTLSVLAAAKDAQVSRVVYSASSSAYGNQDTMPLREDMPAHPISPYGLQKYVGELYCRLFSEVYGLPTVCLRYFNVYGPGASAEGAYALVIAKFLKQRLEGGPMTVTGDGTQTRDYTHVRDVVRANLLAAQSAHVGKGEEAVNIGAGKNASVNKVAELIGGPVEHIAPRLEPHDTLADNSLAKQLLSWAPQVSLEEGIAELKKLANLP